jgi:hypothetical protein
MELCGQLAANILLHLCTRVEWFEFFPGNTNTGTAAQSQNCQFIIFVCSNDKITSRSYEHLVKHIRTNKISLYYIPVDWSENQSVRSLIGVSLPGHTGCSANNSVTANSAESPAPVMKRLQFVLGLIQYRDDQNFTNIEFKTKDKILTTFCCCINLQFKPNIP